MMRLDAKWESLLHLMRKTILLMPTDPSSELPYAQLEHTEGEREGGPDCALDLLLGRLTSFPPTPCQDHDF